MVWEFGLNAGWLLLYCWFARDVTAQRLVVQNKTHFSPLGTKLYFQVNFFRNISILLAPNEAALSCGCRPRTHLFYRLRTI